MNRPEEAAGEYPVAFLFRMLKNSVAQGVHLNNAVMLR